MCGAQTHEAQDLARLWEVLQDEPLHIQIVLCTALLLGISRGELLGLRWEDIDWLANRITIQRTAYKVKGRTQDVHASQTTPQQRTMPLPAPLCDLLKRWRLVQQNPDQGYICCDEAGHWLDLDAATRLMTAVVRRYQLPALTLHGVHHTAEAGVPVPGISPQEHQERSQLTAQSAAHAAVPSSHALITTILTEAVTTARGVDNKGSNSQRE